MKQNPSPILARQITNIGFTDLLEAYVREHRQEIEEPFVWALDNYVKHMRALLSLCDKQSIDERGPYRDLTAPLANEQVATLLQRAVDAGILDCHYQPVPGTKALQLKVIAFAVSSICGFPRAYMHFEKLWKRDHGSRIGTCRAPKCHTEYYEAVKALYPEVDFSTFEPERTEAVTFYAPQSEGALAWDDPDLDINWRIPSDKIILSEKDKHHPRLKDAEWLFDYSENLYQ